MKKKLVASTVLASTMFTSIPVQAADITTRQEFEEFYTNKMQELENLNNNTISQLSNPDNIASLETYYAGSKGKLESKKLEADQIPEDVFHIQISPIITEITKEIESFGTYCDSLIESEQGSESEVELLRQECLNLLDSIQELLSQEVLIQKYIEVKFIWTQQIENATTVEELAEITISLGTLTNEYMIKDGMIQSITADLSLYSDENQVIISDLISEYQDFIVNLEGTEDEITEQSLNLVAEFELKKGEIKTLEDELNDLKAEKLNALNTYQFEESDYSPENVIIIKSYLEDAKIRIEQATTKEDVESIYTSCFENIDQVLTLEEEAELLENYKSEKINEISNYLDKSNYFSDEVSTIQSIIETGIEEIRDQIDYATVDTAVYNVKKELGNVKTKAELKTEFKERISVESSAKLDETKAEIQKSYETAINKIENATKKADLTTFVETYNQEKAKAINAETTYISNKKQEIESIDVSDLVVYLEDAKQTKTKAISDIENATNKTSVESIISDCKSKIELFRENETNYNNLQEAKETAISELNTLKTTTVNNFLPAFKERAIEVINNGITEIEKAISISDVTHALRTTKTQVNSIQTENETEVKRLEQLEKDKETAFEQIQAMKNTSNTFLENYKTQALQLLNGKESQINNALTSEEVTSIVNNLKVEFEKILTANNTEVETQKKLQQAKEKAIQEIQEIDISSLKEEKLREVTELIQTAILNINASNSVSQVNEIKNNTINEINRILDENKNEEQLAEELAKAKEEAIESLNQLDFSHLTESHQTSMEEIIEVAISKIKTVTQKSEIQPIVDNVFTELSKFESMERELETAKNLAISQINQVSTEEMLEKYRQEVESLKNSALEEINVAQEVSIVNSILENTMAEIDKIKEADLAEREEIQEQEQLQIRKETVINQLNQISLDGLLDKNKAEIQKIRETAINEIQHAQSIEVVNKIYSDTVKEINQIKQVDKEEQEAVQDLEIAKENAIKALNEVSLDGLLNKNKEKIQEIITNIISKIEGLTVVQDVHNSLNTAMQEIKDIKDADKEEQTAIQALKTAQENAIKTLSEISLDGLLEKNRVKIQEIIDSSISEVEIATSVDKVSEILTTSLAEIDVIKKADASEQEEIQTLAEAKKQAIKMLNQISLDGLYDHYKAEITTLIQQKTEAIQLATTKAEVTRLFSETLAKIDEIKDKDKAEKELRETKDVAIQEVNNTFLVKEYFTQSDKNLLENIKQETIQNIESVNEISKVTVMKNNGKAKYDKLVEDSFFNYKNALKEEFEHQFNTSIKIKNETGTKQLEAFLTKIDNTVSYESIQPIKSEFTLWLKDYANEKIIEEAVYTGEVSPIDPTIDVSKFDVTVVTRGGVPVEVTSDMISIQNTVFNKDGSCSISFTISNVGNYQVTIAVEAILSELKEDCIEQLNEKYQTSLKYTNETMNTWLETTINTIENAENQEVVLNIYNQMDAKISEFKNTIYKEVVEINEEITLNTEKINEKNVICSYELYSGEIVTPEFTISEIQWKGNQAFVVLKTTIQGIEKDYTIECKTAIDLETELQKVRDEILDKKVDLSYEDIQLELKKEINHGIKKLSEIKTIEDYKNQVSEIQNDVNEAITYYQRIDTTRTNAIAKIKELKYEQLTKEHQEMITNMIQISVSKIATMFDTDKIEEEYQSITKMIQYYQTMEDEARSLQEVKDNKIEEIKKIDISIYKEENKAKDFITETIVSITNAKTKEEVNELFDKLNFELDALEKKAKEEEKDSKKENETISTTQANNKTTSKESEGKSDGTAEAVKTGDETPIIMLSLLGFAGIGCYLYKKKDE